MIGRINRSAIGSQRRVDRRILALQTGTGMVYQSPDCLDVLSHGDAQHPAGVEGKHQHDHDDGDSRTERCFFKPDQEE